MNFGINKLRLSYAILNQLIKVLEVFIQPERLHLRLG
jgi:hypothetical protein